MDKPAGRKLSWWPLLVAVGAIGMLVYAAIPETVPELSELIGKWRRPGEKYVLEVKSIGDDGRVRVRFAPRNTVTIAELRRTIRHQGFTPREAKLTLSARIEIQGGALVAIVPGSGVAYAVTADNEVHERLSSSAGGIVVLQGEVAIDENDMTPERLAVTAVVGG